MPPSLHFPLFYSHPISVQIESSTQVEIGSPSSSICSLSNAKPLLYIFNKSDRCARNGFMQICRKNHDVSVGKSVLFIQL